MSVKQTVYNIMGEAGFCQFHHRTNDNITMSGGTDTCKKFEEKKIVLYCAECNHALHGHEEDGCQVDKCKCKQFKKSV